MKRRFQKLGQVEFQSRVGRVDSHFARFGYSKTVIRNRNERPVLWAIIGFVWIFFVISIAQNGEYLRSSLSQGNLPAEYRDYILYALTGLVAISTISLGFHVIRCLFKGRDHRGASGSIVAGALGAILLTQAPQAVLQDSLSVVMGGELMAAVADEAQTVTGFNMAKIRYVTRQID